MGALLECLCPRKRINDVVDKRILKIHICGKIDEVIVKQVFPDPCEIKLNQINIGDWQWKTEQFIWVAKLYKEKDNKTNFKSISNEIEKDSNMHENNIKNHIILSFGDEDNNELFKQLEELGKVYLPRFIFITKNEGNYSFERKSYITNIIYTDLTDVELITHIKSELWEIDCYYNERGNEKCTFLASNITENLLVSDISINILLTGISRSGKSTFINIVNNSLLSLENCEKSSVTSKITEYTIFGKNKSETDGCLKFIDTAGFNYQTNKSNDKEELYNLEQINNSLFKLIKENKKKTPLEKIHFVLFFLQEGSPLDGTEKVFEMFLKENYNVLFIITRSMNDDDKKSIKKFLNKKALGKLAIEENIINCNLVPTKKLEGYGINTIFKRIFEILKSNNKFYNDDKLYEQLKKCKENIDKNLKVEGKEKELEKYQIESNEIKKRLSEENDLFRGYIGDEKSISQFKQKANRDTKIYITITTSQAFIPIPYSDLALTPALQAKLIHTIFTDFGISLTEINLSEYVQFLLGREISHYGYNMASKKIFEKTAKGCLVSLGKILMADQGGKAIAESMKWVPFLGFIVGSGIGTALNYFSTKKIGDKSISYCENYLREKGFLGFYLKYYEIFNNLFKSIETLSKKENWWDYKMKVIKKNINEMDK